MSLLRKDKGGRRMIYLYTLPTCPICEVIKKKLIAKQITFQERSFEEYVGKLFNTEMAPVLFNGNAYLTSPTAINA